MIISREGSSEYYFYYFGLQAKQATYELFGMFCQHRTCCCYLCANPDRMNHQLWLPKVEYVQSWF